MDESDRPSETERFADMSYCLWRAVLAHQTFLNDQSRDETGFRDVVKLIVNDAGFSRPAVRRREATELVFAAAAAMVAFEIRRNRMYGGSDGQTDYSSWHINELLTRHFTPDQKRQQEREEMKAQAEEMREQEQAKKDQAKDQVKDEYEVRYCTEEEAKAQEHLQRETDKQRDDDDPQLKPWS